MHGGITVPDSETIRDAQDLPAGDFSSWLRLAPDALFGRRRNRCGLRDCIDGCIVSQFIHIEPEESEVLGRVPREILVECHVTERPLLNI